MRPHQLHEVEQKFDLTCLELENVRVSLDPGKPGHKVTLCPVSLEEGGPSQPLHPWNTGGMMPWIFDVVALHQKTGREAFARP